jgi:carboxyl-terminal processing protease
MRHMRFPRRRDLRLAAIVLSLTLAGCGAPAGPVATSRDYDQTRDMFVTGMTDIDAVYIDRVDLGALALAGLEHLSDIDAAVKLERTGSEITLAVAGKETARFDAPDADQATAWGVLAASYIEDAEAASPAIADAGPEKVYETVFNGIVGELDGFSRYAGAVAADENRASREGFGGIGVRIAVADGKVRVVSVMKYTPAQRAGMHADDEITAIDGRAVAGLDQNEVVNRLRGAIDSDVTLTVIRGAAAEPLTLRIARAHIVPETVVYEREGDAAYIHLFGFNADTTESLQREIEKAEQEIGPRFAGLVLDLRDNPGGLLDQAVEVADLFLEEGRIVSTHGRHPDSHQYFEATSGDVLDRRPMIVLVNGNSASASEIVAAALQDTSRAVVVGSNSFGKGTVQTVLRLPNNGELTLTWARFHAPSGYTLNKLGVLPTVCTSGRRAADVFADLSRDRLKPVPVVQRNAVQPTDIAAMDRLRADCPQVKDEPNTDLDFALQLIHAPKLYDRAIALGGAPTLTVSSEPAVGEAAP